MRLHPHGLLARSAHGLSFRERYGWWRRRDVGDDHARGNRSLGGAGRAATSLARCRIEGIAAGATNPTTCRLVGADLGRCRRGVEVRGSSSCPARSADDHRTIGRTDAGSCVRRCRPDDSVRRTTTNLTGLSILTGYPGQGGQRSRRSDLFRNPPRHHRVKAGFQPGFPRSCWPYPEPCVLRTEGGRSRRGRPG